MGFQQDTIIYIEEQDKHDASAAANSFADKNVKNRAYVNTLGAELTLKYLASENINVSGIYNIHSIKKILEELDISDIMLPNIHIDVRVVFDENLIFIPKSHFKYNLVPDIYIVLNLAKDFSHVKILGFFEPKLINKNNQNNDYYFIEKEKLNPVSDLKNYIENFKGNTTSDTTEKDIENSERIIMAMSDNDISEDEKQYLIKQLTKSVELRDKFIEYENFETLSYKAMTDPQIRKKEIESETSNLASPADISAEELVQENNVETFDSIETFDNLELEPVENISLDEISTQKSDENESGFPDGITELGASSAAAAGTAAAAEAVTDITDSAENTVEAFEKTLDVIDSGIEVAKDLVSNDTEEPEQIAFDEIDTSVLDNITPAGTDSYEEETISFENIDTSVNNNEIDYINEIDNKISFDDIETPEDISEKSEKQEAETISLDDIDTSFMDETPNLPSVDEETISLDEIDTTNIGDEIDNPDNQDNDIITFDDEPEDLQTENTNIQDTNTDEPIPFDDTELQLEDLQIDIPENDNAENETATNADSDLNIEPLEVENTSEQTSDNYDDVDFEALNSDLPETPLTNTAAAELEQADTNSSSFGKNLLENINEENISNISIEDLDLEDTNTTQNAEEITSDELLSQIDSLLNTSTSDIDSAQTSDIPQAENQSQTEDNTLADIPDIDDLVSSPEITTDNNNIPSEAVSSDINQNTSMTDNDVENLNIDDLLNMGDDSTVDQTGTTSEDDKLGVLFSDTDPVSDAELDDIDSFDAAQLPEGEQPIPGAAFLKPKKASNKKTLITAAALVAIIAGASAFVFLKPKAETASDIEAAVPTSSEIVNNPKKAAANENVLETNAPAINKTKAKKEQKSKQQVKELKSTPAVAKTPVSSESYLDVKRLVWDVPDALSYSPKIQDYLRTAGKSIKLSLSADLLLATEYAYSNQVKVGLKLSKDGNVQEANIISSSGSTEIDNIVLQSVKDTLNVVKPPSNEISTPDFNLNLIIYF